MDIYFLFSNVNDEYICKYIYTGEGNKVFSYSYDEGYIVKNEEGAFADLKAVESHFTSKTKDKKGVKKAQPPMLLKKEFPDVRHSLYFLNGTLENFNNGVPSRKRLPEIISPYDMDFEETEDFDDFGERGFEEKHGGFDKPESDFDDEPMEDDSYSDDDAYSDDEDIFKNDFDEEDHDDYDDDDDDFFRKK